MFTWAFFEQSVEIAVTSGAAAFAASPFFTGGTYTVHGLLSALVVAGATTLLTFVKQYGASQQAKADSKAAK